MKHLITFLTILTFAFQAESQNNIAGYEYWFDSDFANRVVTNVTPSPQLIINSNIPTAGISAGIHSFNFRSWDDSSRYSSVVSQFFYKISPSTAPTNRDIVEYEYWFDNDYANAVSQTVSSQQTLDLNSIISTGTMNDGIHSFNIRFKDDTELWSSVVSQFFYKISPSTAPTNRDIVEYEYWFDNDYGNAVIQTVSNQQSLDLNTIITTGTINDGIHSFNIRFKDDTDLWSSVLSSFFYKIPDQSNLLSNKITTYRYWFDNDFAQANSVTLVTPVKDLNLIDDLELTQIPKGWHSIHFQFKDSLSLWSVVTTDSIHKLPLPIADFSYGLTNHCDSTTVQFMDNSIDADLYLWDFGDGNTSTDPNPFHSFYNSTTYNVSLTVSDTATGLDSTIVIPLNIQMNTFATIQATACDSFTSPSGNYIWTSSNTYMDTIPNYYNCDSIITVDLTINNSATGTDIRTACDSLVWIDGNTYYTNNNTATYTIIGGASNSCDSIVTLDLTINTVDVSVTTSDPSITANASNATYQWLDCNNGNNPIAGETNQTFTAVNNGEYAVEVTQNGCIGISDCITISTVGIIENDFKNHIILYPNPNDGDFTIDMGANYEFINVVITDNNGRIIQSNDFRNKQTLAMFFDEPVGVYILTITADKHQAVIRIVKEQ